MARERDSTRDARVNLTFDNYILAIAPDGTAGAVQRISDDPNKWEEGNPFWLRPAE